MTRYDHAILAYAALVAKTEANNEAKRQFWADRAMEHHAELGYGPNIVTGDAEFFHPEKGDHNDG